MLWKIFAIISFVLLLAAAYFSFQNKGLISEKKSLLVQEERTLETRKKNLADVNTEITTTEGEIVALESEAEDLQDEKNSLDNKLVESESRLKRLTTNLDSLEAKLTLSQEVVDNLPEIEEIRNQMAEARSATETEETVIAQKEGEKAATAEENNQLESIHAEYSALRVDQDNGIIRGEFESTVTQAFNRWGFVVVRGGNDQGVVNNAQLDVYRGGQFLAKLLVTQVQSNQSAADIVPGTMQPGQTIQPGDRVVKAIKSSSRSAAKPFQLQVAPLPEPTPAAVPAGDDAFGGGGSDDPFGSGGGDDPFGSGGDDPFGDTF